MRIGYLDCYSGISGDMTLGALLDAGLPLAALRDHLALVDLRGYRLEVEQVSQASIVGTRLNVRLDDPEGAAQEHRHWSDIRQLIRESRLPAGPRATAERIFATLAEAEAAVHGVSPDEVHFHEVGAVDSIVDIIGAAVGLELLGIERVYSAPLPLGHGFVQTRHGLLPLPAPAVLEIVARGGLVTRSVDIDRELVTPTGAAIAATLATFSQPAFRPTSIGYGYGNAQLPWPNALRLWVGELEAVEPTGPAECLLETNIDDMPGEVYGYLMERLFEAGALDVFYAPIQMKKNRPAVQVSVIATDLTRPALETILLRETTTFGVRRLAIQRTKCERSSETVPTVYGSVRRKRKEWQGEALDAVPEFEDCARLARAAGVPFRVVYEAARAATTQEAARS